MLVRVHGLVERTRGAASSWEYSFFAPHSVATLVDLMGGPDTFISRLYASLLSEYG